MRPRFTILRLMELTAVVAVIIAADRSVLGGGPQRLLFTFPVIGGLAGAYLGIRLRSADTFEQTVKSARLWAAVVSLINGLIVGIIVAERWRDYDYFEWTRDWFQFVLTLTITTIVSTSAAMLLSMAPAAYISSRKRAPHPQ